MPPPLPPGYTARPPTAADADEVAALIAACQRDEVGRSEMTADELLDDWQHIDLADQAVVIVAPDGRIVAESDILNRRYLRVSMYGYVLPECRGRGLGSYLVGWAEDWVTNRIDRAPEGVQVVLEFYANGANEPARLLLEGRGYPLVRTIYVMEIGLEAPPPAPHWPDGIEVRTFVKGQDEQTLFEAGEEAFADSWSRPPGTVESWTRGTRSPSFDPGLWFLAQDRTTGEIVGLCLGTVVPGGRGWVNTLGVRRGWRRRGLGQALLEHLFGELYRRGVRNVSLSVDADSPTGAPRVYTRAGMHVEQRYHVYRREIRPGMDFAQWTGEA